MLPHLIKLAFDEFKQTYGARRLKRFMQKRAISGYINFYNTKRLHSYNDYLSPIEAEIRWWLDEKSKVA